MTFLHTLLGMEIELTDQAVADLTRLPASMFARYEEVVKRLSRWPQVSGVKWLTAEWNGHARVRFGNYRLVFHLVAKEVIVIDRIAHRKEVYID
jgi:mRNA-degrading endonuclease RelE of RelBE toxin-antitoxin system